MFPEYMDYPEYKEKYPEKTMGEWSLYTKQVTLDFTIKQYEKYKDELVDHERRELEDDIKRMKKELENT